MMSNIHRWFISVTVALVSFLVWYAGVHDVVKQAGETMFSMVPWVPTEWTCYWSTLFIWFSTCHVVPRFTEGLDCFPEDDRSTRVLVVPAKGGIVLTTRVTLEWSWACSACMGMSLEPHKSSTHLAGNGYWPPYEIRTPAYDSDVVLAATLMKRWKAYATTQSDRVRCVVVTRDPLDRLRSHHMYAMSGGDFDLKDLGSEMEKASSDSDALRMMWDQMGRQSMIDSHAYLMDALRDPSCVRIPFEGFRNDFNGTIRAILRAWNVNPTTWDALVGIASAHDLGRMSRASLVANHHVSSREDTKEHKRRVVAAIQNDEEISTLIRSQRADLGYDPDAGL